MMQPGTITRLKAMLEINHDEGTVVVHIMNNSDRQRLRTGTAVRVFGLGKIPALFNNTLHVVGVLVSEVSVKRYGWEERSMTKVRVWRDDKNGNLFHDSCFNEGESRVGFTPVKLDELSDDDDCEACSGRFLSGLDPVEDEDDDDGDEEQQQP